MGRLSRRVIWMRNVTSIEGTWSAIPQSPERLHGKENLKSLTGHHPGRPGWFIVRHITPDP
jgi:hypothetical protein